MKVVCLSVVLCLSALSFAFPQADQLQNDPKSAEDDLKEYLLMVLENLRSEMPIGIPALSIPPLDPFELNNQSWNITNKQVAVLLDFPHLRVVGLSTFKADLDIHMGRMGLEIDIDFQHLKASGKYKLNGKIFKIFPIYGDGDVRVDLLQPRIVLAAQMGVANSELSIEITKMDITWEKLDIHLGNFIGGGSLARVLELILPSLGQKLLTTFNPQILKLLSGVINNVIATHTSSPEIKQMLKNLFGGDYASLRDHLRTRHFSKL